MQMFWSFWKMRRYPCLINKYRTSVCVYPGKTFWNKNGHFYVLNPVSSLILRALKKRLINSSRFHLHFLTFTLQGALINYVWSPIILYMGSTWFFPQYISIVLSYIEAGDTFISPYVSWLAHSGFPSIWKTSKYRITRQIFRKWSILKGLKNLVAKPDVPKCPIKLLCDYILNKYAIGANSNLERYQSNISS
jgi:hypothetical protein